MVSASQHDPAMIRRAFPRLAASRAIQLSTMMALLLLVSACAIYPHGATPSRPAAAALEDTHWRLIALYSEPVRFTAKGRGSPHLLLRTPERQMSGFSGCNGFFGLYQLRGDRLWFEDMAATMQACPNNHDLQTTFYEALKATRRFRIMDAVLILYDEQNEVARFTAVTD